MRESSGPSFTHNFLLLWIFSLYKYSALVQSKQINSRRLNSLKFSFLIVSKTFSVCVWTKTKPHFKYLEEVFNRQFSEKFFFYKRFFYYYKPLKTDYRMTHELLEKTNIGHTVNSLRKAASSNDRNEVAKLARSKCLLN